MGRTATRVKTSINPTAITAKYHMLLYFKLLGINENSNTASTVKTVMEYPKGKLLCPVNFLPMIITCFFISLGLFRIIQFYIPVSCNPKLPSG